MMERAEILAAMADLKLFGMRAAYDELMATAVRRQHEPQRVVGDLLAAEINESEPLCAIGSRTMASARSVKYQITVAKLPFAREIEEFTFDGTPINETLVRDLAREEFLNQQRNVVLVGGTGTGKTHISVAIARAVIRNGARGRFFNVVDLVNKLEAEARAGRAGRLAEHLMRLDFPPRGNDPPDHFLILVDPGRTGLSPLCPVRRAAPVPPDQQALRTDLRHRHHQPCLRRMAVRHGPRTSGGSMAHSSATPR